MIRILGFSTYPVVLPRHGGQKRVAAFREFYREQGYDYTVATACDPSAYPGGLMGADDFPFQYGEGARRGVPAITDLLAGEFAAQTPAAYAHFKSLLLRLDPAIVILEQPFMWPLVERFGYEGLLEGRRLIYSSHNWETELKVGILEGFGVQQPIRRHVGEAVERIETEICRHADLVLSVSEADAGHYRGMVGDGIRVVIVPNGTDRRPAPADWANRDCVRMFSGRAPMLFVGSAHPPNTNGFVTLVAEGGLGFLPPGKSLAVCGGVSSSIFRSAAYQSHLRENEARTSFFDGISDDDLAALQQAGRGTLLPIQFGGGSNLKTAEALVMGKWIVATSTAFRGFDSFRSGAGILIADTPAEFRDAFLHAVTEDPPEVGADEMARRDALHWDGCMRDSGYAGILRAASWLEDQACSA